MAATQHVARDMGTADALCSSHLTEFVAASQPVSHVMGTAYSLCCSHLTELQWLLHSLSIVLWVLHIHCVPLVCQN